MPAVVRDLLTALFMDASDVPRRCLLILVYGQLTDRSALTMLFYYLGTVAFIDFTKA